MRALGGSPLQIAPRLHERVLWFVTSTLNEHSLDQNAAEFSCSLMPGLEAP
jgi:hypothetical protein